MTRRAYCIVLVSATVATSLRFGETYEGSAGNDTLNGTDSQDTIHGNGGDDGIFRQLGNDTLAGGQGADVIDGGFKDKTAADGNDVFYDGNAPSATEPGIHGASDGAQDSINARDGSDGDTVNAGPEDSIVADAGDRIVIRDADGKVTFAGSFAQWLKRQAKAPTVK